MNDDKNTIKHALEDYPGAAVDQADGDCVSAAAVKQETTILNNNPRSSE